MSDFFSNEQVSEEEILAATVLAVSGLGKDFSALVGYGDLLTERKPSPTKPSLLR